jgi:hypothetical protein
MPWTPGHLKSESISRKFLEDDIIDKPIILAKRDLPTRSKGLTLREDLDEKNIDV